MKNDGPHDGCAEAPRREREPCHAGRPNSPAVRVAKASATAPTRIQRCQTASTARGRSRTPRSSGPRTTRRLERLRTPGSAPVIGPQEFPRSSWPRPAPFQRTQRSDEKQEDCPVLQQLQVSLFRAGLSSSFSSTFGNRTTRSPRVFATATTANTQYSDTHGRLAGTTFRSAASTALSLSRVLSGSAQVRINPGADERGQTKHQLGHDRKECKVFFAPAFSTTG